MKFGDKIRGMLVLLLAFSLCTSHSAYAGLKVAGPVRRGVASWYSPSDPGVGRFTANGERFRGTEKTCATWHYNFGTYLKVTNEANGKSVVCRVNDRGPSRRFKKRVIDLSRPAFKAIAPPKHGLVRVKIEPISKSGKRG
jgi:rare lipoprotein A